MTDARLRNIAVQWRAVARPAVVVEVTATRGSVPRETGTRMLVAAEAVEGTIGGGHLEWQAIAEARALLAGAAVPRVRTVALGPTLGQCCGGALELSLQRLADVDPSTWAAPAPLFDLRLYGAGHVGRAIVRLLADLPCRVVWIDEREAEFPDSPDPPHIERVCVDAVDAEVAHAAPGACHLVLTHRHDLDLAITLAVLRRGDFGWLGLIGSRTKRARFEHRLLQGGVEPALLQRLVCPIGLPGIEGKAPPLIALAVVAQLLSHSATAAPGGNPL